MELLDIRTKFIEISGRFDLVVDTTDYADDGADFFIKAGQRYLDSKVNTHKSLARFQKDLTSGDYKLVFKHSRSIREVYASNADGKYELEKKTLTWLRNEYAEDFSEIDGNSPLYYAPAILGLSPEQDDLSDSTYTDEFTYDEEGIKFGDHYSYNGIIILPPVDETFTITVFGDFFSKPLTSDTDKNYWSVNYPDLLIYAAMYSLEKFYRNTEGMKDMMLAINDIMEGIDHDIVAQESSGINIMERP